MYNSEYCITFITLEESMIALITETISLITHDNILKPRSLRSRMIYVHHVTLARESPRASREAIISNPLKLLRIQQSASRVARTALRGRVTRERV
jgi:hypothetical protein